MKKILMKHLPVIIFIVINAISAQKTEACTRVVYNSDSGTVITARSMDWETEIPVNLWIFPRGMKRDGAVGKNSLKWESKYGSIVASAFGYSSADGMNEVGLVTNILWLEESQYPPFDNTGNKKGLAISAWVQYVLDNFATVEEAVNQFEKEEFVIVSGNLPGTTIMGTLHLSISDPSGDNAILEYIDGKLEIHHDKSYNVMTNSPVYEEQLISNNFWKTIPGTSILPGTNRSTDRFVRASFYIEAIPKTNTTQLAVASVFSVIRNCSVPFDISTNEYPEISSTRWLAVADQTKLVYYFETTLTPNTFWVDLKKIDFGASSVKKLNLENNESYTGEALSSFKDSKPFIFASFQ